MPEITVRDARSASSVRKLLYCSLAIIGLPLSSLFISKRFVFEKYFGYSPGDSVIYAAIVAVVAVHIVLAGFIYFAWTEDGQQEIVFQKSESQKQD